MADYPPLPIHEGPTWRDMLTRTASHQEIETAYKNHEAKLDQWVESLSSEQLAELRIIDWRRSLNGYPYGHLDRVVQDYDQRHAINNNPNNVSIGEQTLQLERNNESLIRGRSRLRGLER